jgi:hypothetical protein
MRAYNYIEDEIDRIRLEIYEETKDMSPAQRAERANRIGEEIARQYGLTRVASVPERRGAGAGEGA